MSRATAERSRSQVGDGPALRRGAEERGSAGAAEPAQGLGGSFADLPGLVVQEAGEVLDRGLHPETARRCRRLGPDFRGRIGQRASNRAPCGRVRETLQGAQRGQPNLRRRVARDRPERGDRPDLGDVPERFERVLAERDRPLAANDLDQRGPVGGGEFAQDPAERAGWRATFGTREVMDQRHEIIHGAESDQRLAGRQTDLVAPISQAGAERGHHPWLVEQVQVVGGAGAVGGAPMVEPPEEVGHHAELAADRDQPPLALAPDHAAQLAQHQGEVDGCVRNGLLKRRERNLLLEMGQNRGTDLLTAGVRTSLARGLEGPVAHQADHQATRHTEQQQRDRPDQVEQHALELDRGAERQARARGAEVAALVGDPHPHDRVRIDRKCHAAEDRARVDHDSPLALGRRGDAHVQPDAGVGPAIEPDEGAVQMTTLGVEHVDPASREGQPPLEDVLRDAGGERLRDARVVVGVARIEGQERSPEGAPASPHANGAAPPERQGLAEIGIGRAAGSQIGAEDRRPAMRERQLEVAVVAAEPLRELDRAGERGSGIEAVGQACRGLAPGWAGVVEAAEAGRHLDPPALGLLARAEQAVEQAGIAGATLKRALIQTLRGERVAFGHRDVAEPDERFGRPGIERAGTPINYHDIFTRRGMPGIRIPLPIIVGSDVAGEVAELGSGVEGWKPGDRVLVDPLPSRENGGRMIGEGFDGGRAEYCVAHASQLVRIPEDVSFEVAGSIPLAYATAHRMLVHRGRIAAGEKVLVMGASGGVGTACVLLAKLAGAEVIACASSPAKLDCLAALGADHGVNYVERDMREAVWEIVEKPRVYGVGGVDLVVNCTGGGTWGESIRCLKAGGRLVTCGATAGFEEQIDVRYVWTFEHDLLGSNGWRREDITTLLDHAASERLVPVIDRVMPLDEVREAERLMEEREVFGKVVITP